MKLFILSMIIAGSLAAAPAHAQVRVDAHIGLGTPAPVVVYERDYPGYAYYDYPAWNGHYRDRYYYQHYHRRFERDHRPYFQGRTFDHSRYENERHVRPYQGRGNQGRGNQGRGNQGRGHDDHGRGNDHRN